MKFELYRSGKEWRWRLRAKNGNILASGEGYRDRVGALKVIRTIQTRSLDVPIIETSQ